jgi:hypothetical protein
MEQAEYRIAIFFAMPTFLLQALVISYTPVSFIRNRDSPTFVYALVGMERSKHTECPVFDSENKEFQDLLSLQYIASTKWLVNLFS